MRSKYGVKSLPQMLMGVMFATATTIQMVAPSVAQTADPVLTVTKVRNSAASTSLKTPVTYTISVTNAANVGQAKNVSITDILPQGFTYTSTSGTPTYTGTATRGTTVTDPAQGSNKPAWTNFTIPAASSVSITFIAQANPGVVGTYHNSVDVAYEDTVAKKFTASYNGNSSNNTAEDVTLTAAPALTVTKVRNSAASTSVGYPVTYTITVTNAASAGEAKNINITDSMQQGFTYDLTSGAPTYTGGATRGTTFTDPTQKDNKPAWTNFTIPPSGSVSIKFIAQTNPGLVARTYHNSVSVTYEDAAANKWTANYDGKSITNTAEDVTLTAPMLTAPTVNDPPTTPSAAQVCGKPGSAGIDNDLKGVINSYFTPSASVNAGSNSIALGTSWGGAVNQIDIGDLVLIIQMQDASIDSSNSNLYGSGDSTMLGSGQKDMRASGLYEYAIATSSATSGGTLKIKGAGTNNGLINAYTNADATNTSGQRRFQIIRVPQYASVKLTNTLKALAWDGKLGGVVALDIVGKLDFAGQTISTETGGFRAGYTAIHSSGGSTVDYAATNANYIGAPKGEGTAGTPRYVWNGSTFVDNGIEGYPSGDTGRGAPANAGGGGNFHNAGGGGGGNGGIGGQGGLPWEGSNGPLDASGRPGFQSSIYTPVPWRLMMGGGGGGGDANNATTGVRGGVGGGIAMIRAGTIFNGGTILANGKDGDRGAYSTAPDGAGGGGAGGSVLIQSRNSSPAANIIIEANGGHGGNTANDNNNEHGPGGGGGGGVVAYNVPSGAINASVDGGLSGKANDGLGITHAATDGLVGKKVSFSSDPFTGVNGASCLPKLTVTKVTSTPTVNRPGIAKYKITVTNTATLGSAYGVDIDDTLSTGFTYYATDVNGIVLTGVTPATAPTRTSTVNPVVGEIKPVWGQFTIPAGGKVEINFQAKVATTVPLATYNNQAKSVYPDPAREQLADTIANTYADFATNTGEDVKVNSSNAQVLMVKRITAINGATTNPNQTTINLNQFVHNTSTVAGVPINDQNCYWPDATFDSGSTSQCSNPYTLGAVNAGLVKPGDIIEYTIYFVNSGGTDAKNVKICDLLRPNQTYVADSLELKLGEYPITPLTDANVASIDRGQFIKSTDTDKASRTLKCNILTGTDRGIVAIDITGSTGSPTLSQMPTASTPIASGEKAAYYGWFRFKTKVNP
jgi:uncharacterized repeat protein (TIGR01451 family)/fimbrial isopeptide formation D2 family protein